MENIEQYLPLFIPLAFLVVFPLFWIAILGLLSLVSGWNQLADQYQHTLPFSGTKHHMQSGMLRWVNFRNALTVGANEQGLYLVPMILFRPFHKPLLIPWHEITVEKGSIFIFPAYKLTFRPFPNTKLRLYGRTFDKIKSYFDDQPV